MKPDFWRKVLLAPGNLAGLLAAGLGAIAVPHPAPLIAWLGVETIYVSFAWWRSARPRARASSMPEGWEALAPSQREQYRALRALRAQLEENLHLLPGGKALEEISQPRLDALLDEFVRLLNTLNQHREFLASAEPDATREEKLRLESELREETRDDLREVKRRRLELLEQRLTRIEQVRTSREVVSQELAAIEDWVRLSYEQSVAVRDPGRAGDAVAVLAEQARAAEETVRELERFRDLGLPTRRR